MTLAESRMDPSLACPSIAPLDMRCMHAGTSFTAQYTDRDVYAPAYQYIGPGLGSVQSISVGIACLGYLLRK